MRGKAGREDAQYALYGIPDVSQGWFMAQLRQQKGAPPYLNMAPRLVAQHVVGIEQHYRVRTGSHQAPSPRPP